MKRNNKGFTLVELIVVIVILAILIGVTIGGIYMYVGKAKVNTDKHNLKAMQTALDAYVINKSCAVPNVQVAQVAKEIEGKDLNAINNLEGGEVRFSGTYYWNGPIANSGSCNDPNFNEILTNILPNGFPKNETGGDWIIYFYGVYDNKSDYAKYSNYNSNCSQHIAVRVFDTDSEEFKTTMNEWKTAQGAKTLTSDGYFFKPPTLTNIYLPPDSIAFYYYVN